MATWNDNAITDVGLELLEHTLTAGKTLTLSRAAVGGGHVESAELKDQTELSSVLADVTVLIAEQLRLEGSSGIQIKLQIRNDGITSACTYKQVGIYATDGETEVLFAIYQDANGEEIPSETDYPDFMEIFTAVIALSQTYNVNVTVSSLAYVTKEELNSGLGGKADIEHTHTTSDITDYKEPCNPNLLINPDFLVNQRGQNEYSSGYTVDGWYIEGNKCSVRPSVDGILITSVINPDTNTHVFWQKIENPLKPGKYTFSLNVSEVSGVWSARIRTVNASGDYVDSYYTSVLHNGVNKVSVDLSEGEYISAVSVGINKGTEAGNSLKLAWVKLEVGDGATPFVPPDPATELLRCQRYFTIYKHQNATSNTDKCTIGVGYALTSSIVYAVLPIAAMRSGVTATISHSGLSLISGADTVVDYTRVTALEQTDSTVQVAFTVSGQTTGAVYRLRLMDSNAYLAVSKEL